jgi:hypothetical protein
MRGRLGLIGKEQRDLAGLGTGFERLQLLGGLGDGLFILPALERVAWAAEREPPFFRSNTLSRGWEIVSPVRRFISSTKRGSVQGGARQSRGSASIASAVASARSPRSPEGPGIGRDRRPAMPSPRYQDRHSRIRSGRTDSRCAICGLDQPSTDQRIARARSACARSVERANCSSSARAAQSSSKIQFSPYMTHLH